MRIILYTRTRKLEWDWPAPLARRLVCAYTNHEPGKPITVLSLLDQLGPAPKPGDDTFCGWYSLSLNQYRRILSLQMNQDRVEVSLFNDQIRESVSQLLQQGLSVARIARRLHVGSMRIWNLIRGTSLEVKARKNSGKKGTNAGKRYSKTLKPAERDILENLLLDGLTIPQVIKRTGFSKSKIQRTIEGSAYETIAEKNDRRQMAQALEEKTRKLAQEKPSAPLPAPILAAVPNPEPCPDPKPEPEPEVPRAILSRVVEMIMKSGKTAGETVRALCAEGLPRPMADKVRLYINNNPKLNDVARQNRALRATKSHGDWIGRKEIQVDRYYVLLVCDGVALIDRMISKYSTDKIWIEAIVKEYPLFQRDRAVRDCAGRNKRWQNRLWKKYPEMMAERARQNESQN